MTKTTKSHPKGLSKSRILAHRQCSRRLWLQVYRPELAEMDDKAAGAMAVGHEVGELARTLFPNGVLVATDDLRQAQRETAAALALRPRRPIFEATFSHQRVLARADILYPAGNGYRMTEIKASTKVKDYHWEDAAIQAWVVQEAGIRLHRVEIGHLNKEYVYPGGDDRQGLFVFADVSETVKEMQSEVPGWVEAARRTLGRSAQPKVAPGQQCSKPFPCPFVAHCAPNAATTRPLRRRKIASASKRQINPAAGEILGDLPYPRYYLDFETMQFAVPVWPGTRPYGHVPFQWSCHMEKRAGGKLWPRSFLADGTGAPCRELTKKLLAAVGENGPIFVYSPFEQSRLKELAQRLPDLAAAIEGIIARLVDLLPITRKNYYHPDMEGSWSLKAVLPTIAPDLDYGRLAVSDGLMAQEAFQKIMAPETTTRQRQARRRQLIEYCGQDTLALARLVHFFMEAAKPCRRKPTRP